MKSIKLPIWIIIAAGLVAAVIFTVREFTAKEPDPGPDLSVDPCFGLVKITEYTPATLRDINIDLGSIRHAYSPLLLISGSETRCVYEAKESFERQSLDKPCGNTLIQEYRYDIQGNLSLANPGLVNPQALTEDGRNLCVYEFQPAFDRH